MVKQIADLRKISELWKVWNVNVVGLISSRVGNFQMRKCTLFNRKVDASDAQIRGHL